MSLLYDEWLESSLLATFDRSSTSNRYKRVNISVSDALAGVTAQVLARDDA
jgi:hypothetical protein